MVIAKYNAITAMMRDRRFSEYERIFREREELMGVCYYLSEAEKQERIEEVEDAIRNSTRIVSPGIRDRIEFGADRRLVRLVKEDGESSLRIINEGEGEQTYLELWLHVKPGHKNLEVI